MFDQSPAPVPLIPPIQGVQVWITALTKPNEQDYADLAEQPGASAAKAFLWIFLATLIGVMITGVISFGLGRTSSFAGFLGLSLFSLVCAAPLSAALAVLGFAISVALFQWVAKMLGGAGTFDKLAYVVGAFSAPIALVSPILGSIPYAGLLCIPIGLFAVYLNVLAIKVVNHLGWGKAIVAWIIPLVVLGAITACIVSILLTIMGPIIGDMYSQINSNPNK